MEWSPQQTRALDAVGRWLQTGSDGPQVFRLFGFAGSGKTTLAKHLAATAGGLVGFAAFTGKAAHVLRSKGCSGAQTIHSLIYQPRDRGTMRLDDLKKQLEALLEQLHEEKPDVTEDMLEAWLNSNENVRELRRQIEGEKKAGRKPLFELKVETSALREMDLLVVDEVSMVGEEMAHDLLSFGKKILVLGDPAQLPPVKGIGFFTEAEPDILLTEIHRQARDNPIIAMATDIRQGRALKVGTYGDSRVITRAQADKGLYTSHDQMLVGTNKMRRGCNDEFRRLLGRNATPFPVAGDKLVCLRNNGLLGLLNGSLWNVKKASQPHMNRIALDIDPFDGVGQPMSCVAHQQHFVGEEVAFYEMKEAENFDYGYALTVHKAQGSQWGSVLILDESGSFREHADRWLYTAVTRAAERVTVVKL
jgi:ATP-dependent exoDNAse (exonuclease V) alpha subunit